MDIIIEQIGGMCPVQGYGTIDGERFYFRYRHDDAQLYVGPEVDDEDLGMPDLANPRLYAEINNVFGHADRGWLENDEAVELLHRLVDMLKPRIEWQATGHERLSNLVDFLVQAMRGREVENG